MSISKAQIASLQKKNPALTIIDSKKVVKKKPKTQGRE